MKWLGYETVPAELEDPPQMLTSSPAPQEKEILSFSTPDEVSASGNVEETFITISTPLYTATLSNRSGGSIEEYTLIGENSGKLKYIVPIFFRT